MVNELMPIPLERWPALRDMYIHRKECATGYNFLQTLINWKNKDPGYALQIYSLNGNWETDGTFIVKLLNGVYFNTCGNNLQNLLTALNCLDASQAYLLAGYQDFVTPAVEQHFIDSGLEKKLYKPVTTVWYHKPKDDAKLFVINPPDNIKLKPLEECHAEPINNVWPHKAPRSIEFVKLLIHKNDSMGIFEDNNLVAWCLILPLGSLGLLQVIDSHKRKGLGSLAVCYLSKMLSEKGFEVTAPVVVGNVASRFLFEKLVFKAVDKVHWTEKPANK